MGLLSLIGLIPQALGLATKGIDYFMKRAEGDVVKAQALMQLEQKRIETQGQVTITSMGHPVWWAMWIVFVLPIGAHYAKCVLWDATLGYGVTDPLHGYILEWSGVIVSSIFGLQVGAGVVGAILNRVVKR